MGAKPGGASEAWTEQRQLAVQGVSKRFGGVTAVENVTVTVRRGEIVSVIGPNGAGKTSLLNMISGFYRPTSGTVLADQRHRPGRPAAPSCLMAAKSPGCARRRSPPSALPAPSRTSPCSPA